MQSNQAAQILGNAVMVLIPLILSLTVHEFAHAFVAKRLGDDTAEKMGRLTLNPIAHADPFGTVLLPLLILVLNAGIPFFAWAKPTPINAGRFTRKISARLGSSLVAAAGPLSNFTMAFLCAGVWSLLNRFGHTDPETTEAMTRLLISLIWMNTGLAVFNLLPFHPLDGETIVSGFLSTQSAIGFARFNYVYGRWILFAIVFIPQARDLLVRPIMWIVRCILTVTGAA